ncbi:MAG: hypothetical protein A2365_01585 [Candidatus Nealsonbacteria bacterium RIFOXYB1_FULL_40_15]|uniref:Uncharacterized protein n=2 Tax=Candidatus Nealsoniibacteriota TaxID=1817911 RepID=A0A1G2EMI1_9BACT|nr:MAG: hypothetical protein A2427_00125 [Candidatus Nealsonbacteria bacterium RIFOXYC1_FULL_40_7]OGZ27264.1 MAG: hypothetical protein A2365_01585 [Candidatus Nealsonbacteria bacterium RIFOXYB1_FULL_40_15]OGZ29953.1 MAG: hypothetical protein A2562_02800 [Candidatus Nealsonbacteria bacterium RIFOXYD1_FULL_39_11]
MRQKEASEDRWWYVEAMDKKTEAKVKEILLECVGEIHAHIESGLITFRCDLRIIIVLHKSKDRLDLNFRVLQRFGGRLQETRRTIWARRTQKTRIA